MAGLYAFLRIYVRTSTSSYSIFANSWEISYPSPNQSIHDYLSNHSARNRLPIYVFYPVGSTGQMNNQIIALINALCISRAINGTLVVAPVQHGEESNRDWQKRHSRISNMVRILRRYRTQVAMIDYFYPKRRESLIDDYFDSELIKQFHSIITIEEFMSMRSGIVLKQLQKILVRKGEARDYYDMFQGKYPITGQILQSEHVEEHRKIFSRKELDCVFDVRPIFHGVPFRAGINQNFVFLPRIFRSHLLNCSKYENYWLQARQFLQPHPQIREIFELERSKWGSYLALHLRFKPSDEKNLIPRLFLKMIIQNYMSAIESVDHIYVAYTPSSESSIEIVKQMRLFFGNHKILTSEMFLDPTKDQSILKFKYSMTLLDMWSCVKSNHFIGRKASSLSMNVVHWRETLKDENFNEKENYYHFYSREDFIK